LQYELFSQTSSKLENIKMPSISFLTPAFNNPKLLERALRSLQNQTHSDWEMVISPDDGCDYSGLAATDSRIKLVNGNGIIRSGPGPARTRALMAASGEFVACLDDDDQLMPNFMEAVLRQLKRSSVVLVPSTYVTQENRIIRKLGNGIASMDIPLFADQYGTMHTVVRRSIAKPWQAVFAEDVLHTCQMIDDNGGRAPLAASTYLITVRDGSVCSSSRNIDDEYFRLAQAEFNAMTLSGAAATRALFRKRLDMSLEFAQKSQQATSYHEFVSRLGQPTVESNGQINFALA
jgi:glycosyltransferase involved in cell wall biosynthesis